MVIKPGGHSVHPESKRFLAERRNTMGMLSYRAIATARRIEITLEEAIQRNAEFVDGKIPKTVGELEEMKKNLHYPAIRAAYGKVALWKSNPPRVNLYWCA
jgi:hypothetical protein